MDKNSRASEKYSGKEPKHDIMQAAIGLLIADKVEALQKEHAMPTRAAVAGSGKKGPPRPKRKKKNYTKKGLKKLNKRR